MADNVQIRLVGSKPEDTITILQDPVNAEAEYSSVRRWADLATIREIIEKHADADVYTWALCILPGQPGGTACVVMHDYLSHETIELPITVTKDGVLYEVTQVPLQYA